VTAKDREREREKKKNLAGDPNVLSGAVPDEHRLSPPLNDDVLALRDVAEVNLNLGQGQHISRSGHRAEREQKKKKKRKENNKEFKICKVTSDKA